MCKYDSGIRATTYVILKIAFCAD